MLHGKDLQRIEAKLDQILAILNTQQKEIGTMALDITALQTAVANETTVDASVEALLTQLAAQIQTLIANSGNTVDPAALQAIVTQMQTNAATLSAAVTANTPAAPPAAS